MLHNVCEQSVVEQHQHTLLEPQLAQVLVGYVHSSTRQQAVLVYAEHQQGID